MNRREFLGIIVPLIFLPSVCFSNQIKYDVKKPSGLRLGKEFIYDKVKVKVRYTEEYPPISESCHLIFIREDTDINSTILDIVRSVSRTAKEENKNIDIYVSSKCIIGYLK